MHETRIRRYQSITTVRNQMLDEIFNMFISVTTKKKVKKKQNQTFIKQGTTCELNDYTRL